MRPVNLIPPEDRRGDRAPMRTGVFTYVLVGGLAVLLLLIAGTALTSKQVSDREAEKAKLDSQLTEATARANSLAAFATFRSVQESRAVTVASLAQSRFDWSRVLHELALVLPSNVELSSLTGTVTPEVSVSGGTSVDLRANVAGPALEMTGCASGQDAVAGFVSALQDIDGVTRVGLNSSELPDSSGDASAPAGATSTSGGDSGECQTGPNIAKFQIVVAFDAVPATAGATSAPSVPAPVAPTGSDNQQVADAQTQHAVEQASVREQSAKAQQATHNLIPGS